MIDKDAIYKRVLAMTQEDTPPDTFNTGRCCLPFMVNGIIAIMEMTGLTPIPQAGSASFRFIPEEVQPLTGHTHFEYQWDPEHPLSKAAIRDGKLPEIHCWIAIRETQEIVDFSTGFVHVAAATAGLIWQMPPPPPYIWRRAGDPYPGTCYKPELAAIRFIMKFLQEKAAAIA